MYAEGMRSARAQGSMSSKLDRLAIATRLRALFGDNGIDATAARLRVSRVELRRSVDDHAPNPTIHVLTAVVREYGVDPSWLIHGEYNTATHYASLEDGDVTPITLLAFATRARTPVDQYELRRELSPSGGNGDEAGSVSDGAPPS